MLWIFRMPWLVLLFTSLSQSGSHPVVLLMMSHQLSLKWALHKCTYLPWFPLFCSEDWVSKCVRGAGSERTVKHFFVFFHSYAYQVSSARSVLTLTLVPCGCLSINEPTFLLGNLQHQLPSKKTCLGDCLQLPQTYRLIFKVFFLTGSCI